MASKRRKIALELSMLVKTIREIDTLIIQKVVHVYILLIFTYKALEWWPRQS